MDKKAEAESGKLHQAYLAAARIDHAEEILGIEDQMWNLKQVYDRELWFGHNNSAEKIKIQIDILRSKITNLISQKVDLASTALQTLRDFNRPHVKILKERLSREYLTLERLKFKKTLKVTVGLLFGQTGRLLTNIKSVMEAQVPIAEAVEYFQQHQDRPLSEFVKMVEDIEKNRPTEFPTTTLFMHEREIFQISDLIIPVETLDSDDYRVHILPSQVLKNQINSVDFFTQKNRQLKVA